MPQYSTRARHDAASNAGSRRRSSSNTADAAADDKFRPSQEINRALKPLYKLDNYHGPLALAVDYATIAVPIAFSAFAFKYLPTELALTIYVAAVVIIGAAQRGFATILHESSHKTAAKSRALNWFLGGPLSGWWILQLHSSYTHSHIIFHHPHLGDHLLDPDIENYIAQGLLDQSAQHFIFRNLLGMACGMKALIQLPYVLRHRLLPHSFEAANRNSWIEFLGFALTWSGMLFILLAMGLLDEFMLYWVVPYLTSFQAIGWAIETAEHFPVVFAHEEAVFRTRNRPGNTFERFLTGRHGEWAHLIHHLRPGIPFWAVNDAHAILLQDPDYRSSTARYSGLFTRAGSAAPTIMAAMGNELKQLRFARAETNDK